MKRKLGFVPGFRFISHQLGSKPEDVILHLSVAWTSSARRLDQPTVVASKQWPDDAVIIRSESGRLIARGVDWQHRSSAHASARPAAHVQERGERQRRHIHRNGRDAPLSARHPCGRPCSRVRHLSVHLGRRRVDQRHRDDRRRQMGKALDRDTFKRLLSLYRAIMLKIPLVMMDEPGARRYVRSSPPPR